MRDIKFRAWDERNKRMTYDIINTEMRDGYIGINVISCGGYIVDLMQYAGRKDKDGKDIYEGDILYLKCMTPFEDLSHGNYRPFLCQFKDYGYFFTRKNTTDIPIVSWVNEHGITVIGNIYENPELMEKQ